MELLVVDDHPMVREGLAALLREGLGSTSRVWLADGGEAALRVAAEQPELAVVLLDLRMPGMDGLATTARLLALRPELRVIVLSSSEDPGDVRAAMAAGARGYCPKSATQQTLLAAIDFVVSGQIYVPPLLLDDAVPVAGRLTERQAEVLKLLAQGMVNKEIGQRLQLSDKTVKAHVGAIFKALDVVNRTQAAAAAHRLGLL